MEMNSLNQEYEANSQHSSKLKKLISRRAIAAVAGLAFIAGNSPAEAQAPNPANLSKGIPIIVAERLAEDPTVADDVKYYKGVEGIIERTLQDAKPQELRKIKITGLEKKILRSMNVALTDEDHESAIMLSSQVIMETNPRDGGSQRKTYIDIIDNDMLLKNTRTVQIFKVNKYNDWKSAKKRQPMSKPVEFKEWNETAINAPNIGISDPYRDVFSRLKNTSEEEIKLTKPITMRDRQLGRIGIMVTESWQERNPTDGYRRGHFSSIYPLSTAKKSIFRTKSSNKRFYAESREEWRFKYTKQKNKIDKGASLAKQPKKKR